MANCSQCGSLLRETDTFCTQCRAPVAAGVESVPPQGKYPAFPPPPPPPPVASLPNTTQDGAVALEGLGKTLCGFLVSYHSNPTGEFWPLYSGAIVIGRTSSGEVVDVALPDVTISAKHAAVIVNGLTGNICVEDTDSTNGTFVNNEQLAPHARRDLRDGDELRLGVFPTLVKVIGKT